MYRVNFSARFTESIELNFVEANFFTGSLVSVLAALSWQHTLCVWHAYIGIQGLDAFDTHSPHRERWILLPSLSLNRYTLMRHNNLAHEALNDSRFSWWSLCQALSASLCLCLPVSLLSSIRAFYSLALRLCAISLTQVMQNRAAVSLHRSSKKRTRGTTTHSLVACVVQDIPFSSRAW